MKAGLATSAACGIQLTADRELLPICAARGRSTAENAAHFRPV
jgi:hypothetical protein